MKIEWFLFVAFAMVLLGCNDPHPGFSEIGEEVYFQYHRFGEGRTFAETYYGEFAVKSGLHRESQHTYDLEFGLEARDSAEWSNQPALNERVGDLKQGDSATFLIPFKSIKGGVFDEFSIDGTPIADTVLMRLEIGVDRILDSLAYHQWMAELINAGQQEEEQHLREMLAERNILDDLEQEEGIYFRMEESDGPFLKNGDEVAMALNGYFMNDELFDAAQDSASYVYFTIGKSDQVVPGIEQLLSRCQVGQEVRVYCPSYKAFGRRGSSDGRVPPRTPVYFDFKIVKVFESSALN